MIEEYKGYITDIRKNSIVFECKLSGGDETLFIIEVPKKHIKEKHYDRIVVGRIGKIGITNKGGLSVFLYPDKKFTKKEIQEIEKRAVETFKNLKWE